MVPPRAPSFKALFFRAVVGSGESAVSPPRRTRMTFELPEDAILIE